MVDLLIDQLNEEFGKEDHYIYCMGQSMVILEWSLTSQIQGV